MMDITCPHCLRVGTLKTDVPVGSRVRCPGCQQKFEIQAESSDWEASSEAVHLDEPPMVGPPDAESQSALPNPNFETVLADIVANAIAQVGAVSQPPQASEVSDGKVWEYKVLTQKDKWFSGKFDPERLEQALNAYAKQGWRMKGLATASVPGFGGNRDELFFVLER